MDRRIDVRTDEQMDRWTDRRTDGLTGRGIVYLIITLQPRGRIRQLLFTTEYN